MFDKLFEDVGSKLKKISKVIFVIESIIFIAAGIVGCFALYDFYFIVGIILILVGQCIALVSAWFVYGFGVIVENSIENQKNTNDIAIVNRRIHSDILSMKKDETKDADEKESEENKPKICPSCKNIRTQTPCEHCGFVFGNKVY